MPFPCDIIIKEKEKWIICAVNWNNKLRVSYCSQSQINRSKGELVSYACRVNNVVTKLKDKYHNSCHSFKDGLYTTYYENGLLEIEQYYANGKLEGERKVYYKNGNLKLYECFSEGLIEEEVFWTDQSKIKSETIFKNGRALNSKYYSSNKLAFEYNLNDKGNLVRIKH